MAPIAALAVVLSLDAVVATSRPNFVFMVADDWGWGDVGAYRPNKDLGPNEEFAVTGTRTQTPTLDALAANGTLFTDFHVAQSFCAPARTSFMTGRYPADLKVNTNWNAGPEGAEPNHAAGLPYQLPLPSGKGPSPYPGGLPNIAHVMHEAGYATGHFGKWHLGGLSPVGEYTPKPSEYGFDLTATYGSPIEANSSLVDEQNLPIGNYSDKWFSADTDKFVRQQGIKFIKNATARGVPFYLQLWFHMSHNTIDPRPEQLEDFPFKDTCVFPATALGQTTCPSQIFWGAQTYTDKTNFAAVVAAVDDLGIRDHTYIVFTTDNGAQSQKWNSGHGAFDNAIGTQGPFRGSKASLYEGGHRVPFIVSGPGVPKGRVDHSLISSVDWLPTVAGLAGASIPSGTLLRGMDISDIWAGKRTDVTSRSEPLLWRGGPGPGPCWNRSPKLAARNGDWKLLINPDYAAPESQKQKFPRVELYNVSINNLGLNGAFFEAQNIADEHPDVVKSLAAPLLAWHIEVGPERPGATDHVLSKGARGCESYPFPHRSDPGSIAQLHV